MESDLLSPSRSQGLHTAACTRLPAGVGENNRLGDGQGLVQVAQGVELPILLLHVHVELLDTLQGELVTLDENANLAERGRERGLGPRAQLCKPTRRNNDYAPHAESPSS